jgi:hypothetical protein
MTLDFETSLKVEFRYLHAGESARAILHRSCYDSPSRRHCASRLRARASRDITVPIERLGNIGNFFVGYHLQFAHYAYLVEFPRQLLERAAQRSLILTTEQQHFGIRHGLIGPVHLLFELTIA